MKIVGIIVLVVVLVILAVVAIGYSLPKHHVATRRAVIAAPQDSVWRAIADVAGYPGWRPDVKKVELVGGTGNRVAWREGDGRDMIRMEVVESAQPSRLVVRIASDSLPFGGTWTYRLVPSGAGTEVTITEAGVVYNPVFRFVSRFIIGHTKSIDDFLRALGRKFGGNVEPMDPAAE